MKKMSKKEVIQLCVALAVFAMVYMMYTQWLRPNSSLADTLSSSPAEVVAKSESWELCKPEKAGRTPYFRYAGDSKVQEYPYVVGRLYYSQEKEWAGTNTHVLSDRHYFLGENRWYLHASFMGASPLTDLEKACMKIYWKEKNKVHSETLLTNNLTEGEKSKAEEWIEAYDEGYRLPPFEIKKIL